MKRLTALIPILTLLAACTQTDGGEWSAYRRLSPARWDSLDGVTFAPDSATPPELRNHPARAILTLRYPRHSGVASVPLVLVTESDSEQEHSDTISYPLPRKAKGDYGVLEYSDTIQLKNIPEGWQMTVSPATTLTPNPLTDISLRIISADSR